MGVVGQLALKPATNKKESAPAFKQDKERERTSEKGNGLLDLNLKGVNYWCSSEEHSAS